MTSPLLFLTRLQLSSVASKISLNLLPTGGLLRCVSKGLAPRLMWSHLQPVLLWTQASRPADMFIHSLKLERKEKTTPSTPRFWLQIIQALLSRTKAFELELMGSRFGMVCTLLWLGNTLSYHIQPKDNAVMENGTISSAIFLGDNGDLTFYFYSRSKSLSV